MVGGWRRTRGAYQPLAKTACSGEVAVGRERWAARAVGRVGPAYLYDMAGAEEKSFLNRVGKLGRWRWGKKERAGHPFPSSFCAASPPSPRLAPDPPLRISLSPPPLPFSASVAVRRNMPPSPIAPRSRHSPSAVRS